MSSFTKKNKTPDSEKIPRHIAEELSSNKVHAISLPEGIPFGSDLADQIYNANDLHALQSFDAPAPSYKTLKSLDELLERDERRQEDGFKRKINVGKIIKPGRGGSKQVVIIPTTTEDKFYHDNRVTEDESEEEQGEGETGESAGTAKGEEGDVIGERPLTSEQEGAGQGAGQGNGEEHDVGASAYELGKILTEKFKLPNLKDKGARKTLTKYTYDLTDKNRGHGQVLDKKNTLMEIIKTNISLERFDPEKPIDPENLLINPHDYVYRVLSKEKDYESQAIVFFLRDYSGSMSGRPTEIVCTQHVMIYSWLMYQYKEQALARFIVHDTDAKEAPDFYTYYNMNVAGGTKIVSSLKMVNEIVEKENLASNYNIYIFYGGDGDDWNTDPDAFEAEFNKIFSYVNRMGITIVKGGYGPSDRITEFEKFLKNKSIIEKNKDLVHLDVIDGEADDKRIVEGIKELVS